MPVQVMFSGSSKQMRQIIGTGPRLNWIKSGEVMYVQERGRDGVLLVSSRTGLAGNEGRVNAAQNWKTLVDEMGVISRETGTCLPSR